MNDSTSEPHETDSSLDRTFTTQDLDLASYLAVRGINPAEVRPPLPNSFPNFATFAFAPSDRLDTAIDQWASNEPLTVDVHEFLAKRHSNYRLVRSLRGGARSAPLARSSSLRCCLAIPPFGSHLSLLL